MELKEILFTYGWAILIIIVVMIAICYMATMPSTIPQPPECQRVCEGQGYSYKATNMNDCYCLDKTKCYFIENRTYCEAGATVVYSRM